MDIQRYFVVELNEKLDGFNHAVLLEEKDLVVFLQNYDKDFYTLINVCGIGALDVNFKDYFKNEPDLEKGDSNVSQ
jgi:hypothetical protein